MGVYLATKQSAAEGRNTEGISTEGYVRDEGGRGDCVYLLVP